MSPIFYVIYAVGLLLEILILWRGLTNRLWRHYPYFYACLGYFLVISIAHPVFAQADFRFYAIAYWVSTIIGDFLCFLIVWEVFRQVFPLRVPIRRLAALVIAIFLIGLTATFVLGIGTPGGVFADMERKVGLAQAVVLGVILILAHYYAIPLGRNIWGMALGFGLYVSVSIMNFAAFELFNSFFAYWRLISPSSFVSMLAVWTWALWSYAPNPQAGPVQIQDLGQLLAKWKLGWKLMRAAMRKAAGR